MNLASTGEAVYAYSGQDRSVSFSREGEVRTYAGGRRRAIGKEGEIGRFVFVMRDVSWTDIERLRLWEGLQVQVRDSRGRLFNGVFWGFTAPDRPSEPLYYDVSFTLELVTAPEGV